MLPDYAACAVRKLENLFVSQYSNRYFDVIESDIYIVTASNHTVNTICRLLAKSELQDASNQIVAQPEKA